MLRLGRGGETIITAHPTNKWVIMACPTAGKTYTNDHSDGSIIDVETVVKRSMPLSFRDEPYERKLKAYRDFVDAATQPGIYLVPLSFGDADLLATRLPCTVEWNALARGDSEARASEYAIYTNHAIRDAAWKGTPIAFLPWDGFLEDLFIQYDNDSDSSRNLRDLQIRGVTYIQPFGRSC